MGGPADAPSRGERNPTPKAARPVYARFMSEEGRKKLLGLAAHIREKSAPTGMPTLDKRGLDLVDDLAKTLTGSEGMPGLRLYRENTSKFRLERPPRNADIWVEWQRSIGALVVVAQKFGNPKTTIRFVWDESAGHFRSMEDDAELYADVSRLLVDYLYPEAK